MVASRARGEQIKRAESEVLGKVLRTSPTNIHIHQQLDEDGDLRIENSHALSETEVFAAI